MPKRAATISWPEIRLDQRLTTPLYKQLYERLRAQVLTGQLEPGARLPSTRTLASELGISRNTTALAFEMLQLEGYIESQVGAGARVARAQPEQVVQPAVTSAQRQAVERQAQPLAPGRRGQRLAETPYPGEMYGQRASAEERGLFRAGQPDVAAFPFETWARLLTKHARQSLPGASLHQPAQGYAPLREAIAAHVGVTRGVRCSPEQIIITAGAQGALDLVARVLLDAGDRAWVEQPGYLGARGALLAAGARLIGVPVDVEGMRVVDGRAQAPQARLVVVTPSHQFPTGVTMSLPRRLALLEWAAEARAWIVEDDYDSEYRYSGRPLEALQGLDSAGCVVYIGTFSKTLFPALRLGYLVAPPTVTESLLAARRFIDTHPPTLEQMALAEFIADGHFARHLRRMRLLYLARRNALSDALTHEAGDLLEVSAPEAGLHLVAWLRVGLSAQAVAQAARIQGLRLLPITSAAPGGTGRQREGLLFGFGSDTPDQLRAGVHTLAHTLRGLVTQ